jgi:hypothetical protein
MSHSISTPTPTPGIYGPSDLGEQPAPWWTAPPTDTSPADTLANTGVDPLSLLAAVAIVFFLAACVAVVLEVRKRRADHAGEKR